jgi:transposase-like protein
MGCDAMGWDSTPEEREKHRELMKERAKELFCPNGECGLYGQKGRGNIVFQWKYGKEKSQNLFRCNRCKKTFSERRGTPLFYMQTPDEKIIQTLRCLVEGNGIRGTARIMGMSKDTVMKIVRLCGEHCKELHDYFVRNLHIDECQLDEFWSFIKKTKKSKRRRA